MMAVLAGIKAQRKATDEYNAPNAVAEDDDSDVFSDDSDDGAMRVGTQGVTSPAAPKPATSSTPMPATFAGHEVYGRFYKMLKVRIPAMNVAAKMRTEGIDCDIEAMVEGMEYEIENGHPPGRGPNDDDDFGDSSDEAKPLAIEQAPNTQGLEETKEPAEAQDTLMPLPGPNGLIAPPEPGQGVEGPGDGQVLLLEDLDRKMDLSGLEPIPMKNTLVLVNSFVVNTVEFMNNFVSLCEAKLQRVSRDIQRMEVMMDLAEGKLESIEWLKNPPQERAPAAAPTTANAGGEETKEEAPPEPEKPKFKDHPDYGRFFKMLKFGVPPVSVEGKISAEGLDPSVVKLMQEELNG